MGLGRPKVALILTDDERVRLDSLAHRSRTASHLARRARIIPACAEGHDNKVVAKRLRMSQVTVCKWRGRFLRERLDGLYDEPRLGAPRQISDEQIEQVLVRALEATPRGTHPLEQPRHGESERVGPHRLAAMRLRSSSRPIRC
jgi:Homeodomain-like domain